MTGLALDLIGAEVLFPDGIRQGRLSFADGVITADPVGRSVDLDGFLVLPGIIDLHGDGFERHLAPRRGAMKEMVEGVVSAEAELAANGVTTGVMAQFFSWEGGLRGPEFAARVFAAIRDVRDEVVTDLIPQLRFEINLLDYYEDLPAQVAEWGVDYVVFNDHLPHDRLAQGKKPPRLTGQALKAGRNPERHWELLQELHRRSPDVPAALDKLVPALTASGIRMGSHDDHTAADRATWRARGVRIAEFPETTDAAEAARNEGDSVVLGAPNVVRGGSHKGNASAVDLITMGFGDALASDYHYPSPRRAALMLARSGICDLASAWRLLSDGPARILGLADRGRFESGMRADIVVLDTGDHRVAATVSAGRVSYIRGEIASRLIR
ncbi:alpha-D-ribose 1-methylphosphonate 5-triphosphate diphosphatase [Sedimentitalea todarodis]|uniref:Alpha-D-ribose 1-methylphosphonate 5-triphosphate diphosphatase n=1 Tax=Sedimentitalea todarodis TaxID=1631240 RepID=A0ABU3VHU9_9RHOB|nr:alpha-D-ribose 1-methylphosphonate 5-triphosphate diphosphatase [Sedimentitalea todarodis]MDU9005683.1 alpha-D-ribose 1-methylphosphonate 5-triphosphate diphosphatase [Sedimentitalea todarodis]